MSFIEIHPYFVFIILAIFISIFTEGVCQIGIERCLSIYGKEEASKNEEAPKIGEVSKNEKEGKGKNKKRKRNIFDYIILSVFDRPTIFRLCKNYASENDENNPMEIFYKDLRNRTDSWSKFHGDKTYNAVHICARIIERDNKIADIYHYRDLSFMIQMLRLSFMFIVLVSFISLIVFWFSCRSEFSPIKSIEGFWLIIFSVSILLLSSFFTFLATHIARSFGKRFIREVRYTYEAFMINSPTKQKKRILWHR
jgi:hypothetical protein